MRTGLVAVMIAVAMAPATARAAPPVATTVGRQIELHIDALGIAPPDYAMVGVSANGVGDSEAAARAALDAQKGSVAATLASAAGVAPASVAWEDAPASEVTVSCMPGSGCMTDIGEIVAAELVPAKILAEARLKKVDSTDLDPEPIGIDEYGSTRVRLWIARAEGTARVENPSAVPELVSIFSQNSQWSSKSVAYEFNDRTASHKAALTDGLAKARAEADAYAASIGYRVVRIARLSNRGAPFSVTDMLTLMTRMDGPGKDASFLAAEFAPVGVDFVLAPK